MTTARQLIADGDCTGPCLIATSTSARCTCKCNGRTHSALVDADVTALLDDRAGFRRHSDDDLVLMAGVPAW